jgi:hypothetical protein
LNDASVSVSSICLFGTEKMLSARATTPDAPPSASVPTAKAATPSAGAKPASSDHLAGTKTPSSGAPTRYTAKTLSKRAQLHYDLIWGVDSLQVKYAESGEMIRFSYRVLDIDKADAQR